MSRTSALVATLKFVMEHPLNRGRRARALMRYVRWQVRSRLVPGPVVYRWVSGSKIIVRAGETGLTGNIYCGLHEFADMAYLLHVTRADDLFVDIGANAGSYTVLACAVRGARGYCCEPVPATFQRLLDNVAINNISGRVEALNVGLSDRVDEVSFTAGLDCANHVLAKDEHASEVARVTVLPLDAVLRDEAPTILKIDVEGFETRVLSGAVETLGKPSLHSVIMELNGSGRRYGFSDADLIITMKRYGFSTYSYEPFSRELRSLDGRQTSSGNTLFVRDVSKVRDRVRMSPAVSAGGVWF